MVLQQAGRDKWILISCLGDGDTGGGLLWFDGVKIHPIDALSTTGLCAYGEEVCRVLWAPSQTERGTSILRYDQHGLVSRLNIDGLTDPHDLAWTGFEYIAVSSMLDAIFWITAEGAIRRTLQLAPGGDCWHVNCLLIHKGRLLASAFGRFDSPRGWKDSIMDRTGFIFDVDTNTDVLAGLCCPHTPRFDDGAWLVCNSARSELLVLDSDSRELRQTVALQNWTRGVAVLDDCILVGESVNRLQSAEIKGATVAVLDRETKKVRGRLILPYREVYDLLAVDPVIVSAIPVETASPSGIPFFATDLPTWKS